MIIAQQGGKLARFDRLGESAASYFVIIRRCGICVSGEQIMAFAGLLRLHAYGAIFEPKFCCAWSHILMVFCISLQHAILLFAHCDLKLGKARVGLQRLYIEPSV